MSGQKNNKLILFILTAGFLITLFLTSPALASEVVREGSDRFVSIRHDKNVLTKKSVKKEIIESVYVRKDEMSGSDEKYERVDIELLTLSPPKYSFSLYTAKYDNLNIPGSVIDFGSGVYFGSPIFTLDKERLYKGAGEEDLESGIGAAVKLVILNR